MIKLGIQFINFSTHTHSHSQQGNAGKVYKHFINVFDNQGTIVFIVQVIFYQYIYLEVIFWHHLYNSGIQTLPLESSIELETQNDIILLIFLTRLLK